MPLRLTTWNCKGAFDRKHTAVAALESDILVLPEAGRFSEAPQVHGTVPVRSYEWIGNNPTKGLGVISYGKYELSVHESYDRSLKWILPLMVTGPHIFNLLALWTVPHDETGYYISCLFEACKIYRSLFEQGRLIIAGDFNQNILFDKPRSQINYSRLLDEFTSYGLLSLYHLNRRCDQGQESEPTFFLHHKFDKPHHLDYIFATSDLYQHGVDISVGNHAEWGMLSDHMPLTCTFNI